MPAESSAADSVADRGSPELELYASWREPVSTGRIARAAAGSLVAHAIAIVIFVALPDVEPPRRATVITTDLTKAVRIYSPKYFEPTQKAPNSGKVSRELDVRSIAPAPRPQAPRFRAPQPAPGPLAEAKPSAAPPAPSGQIQPPRTETPKIETAMAAPPPVPTISANPKPDQPPPPAQAAAPKKPKLAFESIAEGQKYASNPDPSVPDPRNPYVRSSSGGGGGTIVGDAGASNVDLPSINSAPALGRPGSNLQLLSDAKGVDFRPYLIQVLTAVRRNWLSILPDSARLGQRGRVLIQFAIDRNGAVPKVVIAEGAGAETLDRAAVTAISMSYPFPPLPKDYQGDEIRLQFAFSYNMPR
ncbi:MAG TPA: TonB family protein [Bryobacteraceae bacterium]|nr:TonB family protein [Bryobacteraceae bacterium]